MSIATQRAERADRFRAAYLDQAAALAPTLPGHGVGWLDRRRARAAERFAEIGFPSRRDEAWTFTDPRPLTRAVLAPAPKRANGVDKTALSRFLPAGVEAHLVVFVDGHFRADLSALDDLPEGVRLGGLAATLTVAPDCMKRVLDHDADAADSGPVALNAALAADGAVLRIADGVALARPIAFLYLASGAPAAMHLRNVVVAGAGARASLIEVYGALGDAAYWTNAVTDLQVADGASIAHLRIQGEAPAAFHLAATRARLGMKGAYRRFALTLGGRLARDEVSARIEGEDGDCRLDGLYLGRDRQHLDTTTVIDHLAPGGASGEHYKGVVDDRARGVFQGRIVVHPDAQGTDAHQLAKALLLSETAEIDAKPELEINADDVKCSHGAAAGEIDADALFYLRARGIDAERARHMLIGAFADEVIERVAEPALRAHVHDLAASWLASAGG